MKLNDVHVGQRYHAKVSGRVQVVRVTELRKVAPARWSTRRATRTLIIAVNEATGRPHHCPLAIAPAPIAWQGMCPYCGRRFGVEG